MKIIINYHNENILAEVIGDHKVAISHQLQNHKICIELDQCKTCGEWRPEDEELYGDGYCATCCNKCDTCQQYKPWAEMMSFKTIDCNQCVSCNQIKKYKDYEAPVIEVSKGDVKVCLEYIGEGSNGDFINDGIDKPLMRFSVVKKEPCDDDIDHPDWNWVEVDDSSYCTQIPVDTDKTIMTELASIILNRVQESVMDEDSIKKLCQELSWIDEDWIKKNR